MTNRIGILLFISLITFSCKKDSKLDSITPQSQNKSIAYTTYGKVINDADALLAERMLVHYNAMKEGDTINAKMKGKIVEICSAKGCWMKLDMGNGQVVRVKFKDYAFFMPVDATGEAIINGKAFVSETSVEDLRHYAEDAGKTTDEIAAITQPEKTYGFLADGVLLAK